MKKIKDNATIISYYDDGMSYAKSKNYYYEVSNKSNIELLRDTLDFFEKYMPGCDIHRLDVEKDQSEKKESIKDIKFDEEEIQNATKFIESIENYDNAEIGAAIYCILRSHPSRYVTKEHLITIVRYLFERSFVVDESLW